MTRKSAKLLSFLACSSSLLCARTAVGSWGTMASPFTFPLARVVVAEVPLACPFSVLGSPCTKGVDPATVDEEFDMVD
jgi:hypothetical protein